MTPLRSLNEFPQWRSTIRVVATDMDGTLTRDEEFSAALLTDLGRLEAAGIAVVITTGRSAGWVSGLAHYLPVAGMMAENGGAFFPGPRLTSLLPWLGLSSVEELDPRSRDEWGWFLGNLGAIADHRAKLAGMFEQLRTVYPDLEEAADNRFRQTDWTFDVQGLSDRQLDDIAARCQGAGFGFTYSNVQCHIQPGGQTKARGLSLWLDALKPGCDRQEIVTVGDSPNDESMFDLSQFPCSVGVANVGNYRDRLDHLPAVITDSKEGYGFGEFVDWLLG
ncbi:MAG: HAD family hydrolase [Cyanobacteria bacterium P01_D01_bin.73]